MLILRGDLRPMTYRRSPRSAALRWGDEDVLPRPLLMGVVGLLLALRPPRHGLIFVPLDRSLRRLFHLRNVACCFDSLNQYNLGREGSIVFC